MQVLGEKKRRVQKSNDFSKVLSLLRNTTLLPFIAYCRALNLYKNYEQKLFKQRYFKYVIIIKNLENL